MKAVLEKILAECEEAMLRRTPIIFLETREEELVRRVVESDRLVVRVFGKSDIADKMPFADENAPMEAPMKIRIDGNRCWSKIYNVFGYSSLKNFSEKIGATGATDALYGLPNKGELPNYPCMFLMPAPEKQSNVASVSGVNSDPPYAGIHRYIERYHAEADRDSKLTASCILVYGEQMTLPEDLLPYCDVVEEPFPTQEEILAVMDSALNKAGLPPMLNGDMWKRCARAMTGFPLLDVERLIDYILSSPDIDGGNSIYDEKFILKTIAEKKRQLLKKSQILEIIEDDGNDVGGMQKFKEWIKRNESSLNDSGRLKEETGATSIRGVLLCGVPGCGKSMAARMVRDITGLPLLRMDIGSLMGKYVGVSEDNLRKAIRLAEAMAPCILWSDEIEKGFSYQNSNDSGVSKRMFGYFLTWLQECKLPVFNFATANDITALPPEFFRSGRFDGLFALYMPTHEECVEILQERMNYYAKQVRETNARALFAFNPKESAGKIFNELQESEYRFCNGADIEKLVAMALRQLFDKQALKEPIDLHSWVDSMKDALAGTTVFGDSSKNIDSIACTHFRLLREGFQPAANACILEKGDYRVVDDEEHRGELKLEMTLDGSKREDGEPEERARNRAKQQMKGYDLALCDAVIQRFKVLAPLMEAASRRKIVGV